MKIAVLVSGGVDSSVALALLKQQGHAVEAFYLKIWLEDELAYLGDCPWQEDLDYAQAVCKQLAVPLHVISLQKEYWQEVVGYTIAEIKAGRTPNPDMLCNQRIKFAAFLNKIDDTFEKVATGHYAQVKIIDGMAKLYMAPDAVKDQTYFLSHLTQNQLQRALFPIGHLKKSEVRALATQLGLATKNRRDSQGICFLGKLDFADFLAHHLGEKQGDLIEIETGTKMGSHKGYWFYTIGQRQGLGLAGGPWYVVAKDSGKNVVYISRNYYSAEKKRNIFSVSNCNWFLGSAPTDTTLQVKVRHGAQLYDCAATWHDNGIGFVILSGNDQGIAAGQFAVFYKDNVCLGGGVIT